jgi:phospholipase C
MSKMSRAAFLAALSLAWFSAVRPALADGNLNNVNHIIVLVQENHSFDNYFGALAYAPGSPYHNGNGVCSSSDHHCLDGLTCTLTGGNLNCTNSNINLAGQTVFASHSTTRCITDPDHSWYG